MALFDLSVNVVPQDGQLFSIDGVGLMALSNPAGAAHEATGAIMLDHSGGHAHVQFTVRASVEGAEDVGVVALYGSIQEPEAPARILPPHWARRASPRPGSKPLPETLWPTTLVWDQYRVDQKEVPLSIDLTHTDWGVLARLRVCAILSSGKALILNVDFGQRPG